MGGDSSVAAFRRGGLASPPAPERQIRLRAALMADNEWVLLQLPETLTGYGRVADPDGPSRGASRSTCCASPSSVTLPEGRWASGLPSHPFLTISRWSTST